MNTHILRKDIYKIKSYIPGKPIDLVQRQLGIKKVVKLASNENALGAPKSAKVTIKKSLNEIFRYPDGSCYYLKKALAKKLNLKTETIIFGNGSDEIIDIIIKTLINPEENILTSQATFLEYEIIAKANGHNVKCIPLRNFRYDLKAMRNNLTKKTKAIFIANPNNPTGTYITQKELENFISHIPSNVVIVIDEAYKEFVDTNDYPQTIKYLSRIKNLIILRTFSKAYGLAGLRIGYALANPILIQAMERIRQPFNVNFLAQQAAKAALNDAKFVKATRRIILNEKYRLYKEFDNLGITYIPSQANFIMFKSNFDGLELCKKLLKKGIIIRDLKQYKLDKFVRVTIGKPDENKLFIKELRKILGEKK